MSRSHPKIGMRSKSAYESLIGVLKGYLKASEKVRVSTIIYITNY
jgi:hypothetical protein